jgi:hypothetical protein
MNFIKIVATTTKLIVAMTGVAVTPALLIALLAPKAPTALKIQQIISDVDICDSYSIEYGFDRYNKSGENIIQKNNICKNVHLAVLLDFVKRYDNGSDLTGVEIEYDSSVCGRSRYSSTNCNGELKGFTINDNGKLTFLVLWKYSYEYNRYKKVLDRFRYITEKTPALTAPKVVVTDIKARKLSKLNQYNTIVPIGCKIVIDETVGQIEINDFCTAKPTALKIGEDDMKLISENTDRVVKFNANARKY